MVYSYDYSRNIDVLYYLQRVIETNTTLNLANSGNSIIEVISSADGDFTIVVQNELTPSEKTILDAIVANYKNAFVRGLDSFTSFNLGQFTSEISENQNITANIVDSRVLDNKVSINFDADLSESEISEIDSIISNFSTAPMYVVFNGICNQYASFNRTIGMAETRTKSSDYETMYSYVYSGATKEPKPRKFSVVSNMEGEFIQSYDIRVFDFTNSAVICERTGLTNVGVEFITIDGVTNIPDESAIWEIHMKANFESRWNEMRNRDYIYLRGFYFIY